MVAMPIQAKLGPHKGDTMLYTHRRKSRSSRNSSVILSTAAAFCAAPSIAQAQLPQPTQGLLDTFTSVVNANTSNPQILSLADRIVDICPQLTLQFDPTFDPANPDFNPSVDNGRASGTVQGDLVGRCTAAVEIANGAVPGVDPSAVIGVLGQIAGEEVIALDSVVSGAVRPQSQAIAARIGSFSTAPSVRLAFKTKFAQPVRLANASAALGYATDYQDSSGGFGSSGDLGGGVGGFLTGYYYTGNQDPTALESGFDFDGYAITGGLDYEFAEGLILGVAGGYSDTDIEFDAAAGDISSDAISVSGYGVANIAEALQASLMMSYSCPCPSSCGFCRRRPTGVRSLPTLPSLRRCSPDPSIWPVRRNCAFPRSAAK